jgi:hypothetical protein
MRPTYSKSLSGMFYLTSDDNDITYTLCYDGPAYRNSRGIFIELCVIRSDGSIKKLVDEINEDIRFSKFDHFFHSSEMKNARKELREFRKLIRLRAEKK